MKAPQLPQGELEFAKQCALRVIKNAVEELEVFFAEDGVEPNSERYIARVSGALVVLGSALGALIGTKVPTLKNLHETVANTTSVVMQAANERWKARQELKNAAAAAAAQNSRQEP